MLIHFVFRTILKAALKVVDDSSEDGWEVHHMSALSKTQNKQLIPAGTHQTGVCLLTEKDTDTQRSVRNFTIIHCIPLILRECKMLLLGIPHRMSFFIILTVWLLSFTSAVLPESWEGRDGASPVHGEKEKPGCWLADIMYIQILWHGARHRQLHKKRQSEGQNDHLKVNAKITP